MTTRRWATGLLLVSAALLAFELLLMRLLALAYWGHFAGMVISIAMLGIACSGLFLFFVRRQVPAKARSFFSVSAGLLGVAAPLAFLLAQRLPFTPFLLTWSMHEYALLAVRSLLFFVPFFLAGIAIGTPFVARVLPMGRLYFWNMIGSGLPALPLLFAMNFTHPMRLLVAVTILALGAACLGARRRMVRAVWIVAGLGVMAAVLLTPFRYSQYKEFPKTMLLPDATLLSEQYGWDGVVQVVDSPHTRYLPGLSLNFAETLPPAKIVFTDAGAMTLAFAPEPALAHPAFLRMTPEAFSFSLTQAPRVLHFYGSTADLLRARFFGARDLHVIDDNATRVKALRQFLGTLAPLLEQADARQKLAQEIKAADVIAVSLLGPHGTSTAGAASLEPSFLLTLEGCGRLFDRLSPEGHAVVSTWVENPPRNGIRLATLWIETLRRQGIEHPSRHLIALRSYSTLSIFVSRAPFHPAAIHALRVFCDENSFDLVWYDGIDSSETNRVNVLPEEPYYAAFAALLGERPGEFIARSPFALDPPTDDRPFFNQYFRWAAVPQWIHTMGMDWLPFVEWGYLLQVATLLVVTGLGFILLIVPCFFTRARPRPRTATLFFSLGVAYIFVQIWAILMVSHLVGHALLASALVLSAMLMASGAGAALLAGPGVARPGRNFGLLVVILGAAMLVFPTLLGTVFSQTLPIRVTVALLWIAAPAFCMGFPFPYALDRLARESEVPWALALNGFGSVLGALLATLVAVHFGLRMLAGLALAAYLLVAVLCRFSPLRANE